jgi:hypothetical protein
MTGYEDLDDNGDWSYVASYGDVLAATRYRRWDGLPIASGTGRTSDRGVGLGSRDEPWGFAPFHYGRWAFSKQRMVLGAGAGGGASDLGACAGRVRGRRTQAFRFSAGVGVGWFPLAPGEVYRARDIA